VQTKQQELEAKISSLEKSLKESQGSLKDLQSTVDSQRTTIDQQKSVLAALQRAGDEAAIVNVLNTLATDVNGRDFKSSRDLFEEFVDYDEYCVSQQHPRAKLAGDDLVDNLKKSEGVYKGLNWLLSNPHITVNGDEATLICQFRMHHFQAHNEKGVDFLENQGTFKLGLARSQGRWRIKLWKYTSLASQTGNPRLHDIALKYADQFGTPASPAPRTSQSHMSVGVAIMVPGKNASELRHTVTEKKKDDQHVEVAKVSLKKTEPVKKEEPKKVEIPKTKLASSSMSKEHPVVEAPPADVPAPAVETPAEAPATDPTSEVVELVVVGEDMPPPPATD